MVVLGGIIWVCTNIGKSSFRTEISTKGKFTSLFWSDSPHKCLNGTANNLNKVIQVWKDEVKCSHNFHFGELSQVSEALKESDTTDTNNIWVMPLIRKWLKTTRWLWLMTWLMHYYFVISTRFRNKSVVSKHQESTVLIIIREQWHI